MPVYNIILMKKKYEMERKKFLFYLENGEFWNICFADVINDVSSIVIDKSSRFGIHNRFIRALCRIHHSVNINNIMRLPLKKLWTKTDNVYKIIKKYNIERIIFTDTSIREFDYNVLKEYKRLGCEIIVVFLNPIKGDKNSKYAVSLVEKNLFYKIYTVDINDADKYKFIYTNQVYSKIKDNYYDNPELDICFVGKAKDRLTDIKKVIEKLNSRGIRGKYYISDVRNNDIDKTYNTEYNKILTYSENLGVVFKSKCILEILQPGQTGNTFRTYEAVCYNKKLLTNNPRIKDFDFYDSRYMRYFEEISDDDIDFILEDIVVDYKYNNEYSPSNFIKNLG